MAAPDVKFVLQAQQLGTGLRQVHVDRVELLNGRQQGRFTLADQCTFGDLREANAAGNRRGDRGVAEIEARRFPGCLGWCDIGGGLLLHAQRIIVFLLADCVGRHQRLVALRFQVRLRQVCFGFRQHGLRVVVGRFEWRGINAEQYVASLDVAAFAEHAFQHDARHAGAHLRDPGRFQPARQFRGDRDALRRNRDDADFWRRHAARYLRVHRFFAASGNCGQHQHGCADARGKLNWSHKYLTQNWIESAARQNGFGMQTK